MQKRPVLIQTENGRFKEKIKKVMITLAVGGFFIAGIGVYKFSDYNAEAKKYETKLEKNLFFKKKISYEKELATLDSAQKCLKTASWALGAVKASQEEPQVFDKSAAVMWGKNIEKRKEFVEAKEKENYEKNTEMVAKLEDATWKKMLSFAWTVGGSLMAVFSVCVSIVLSNRWGQGNETVNSKEDIAGATQAHKFGKKSE